MDNCQVFSTARGRDGKTGIALPPIKINSHRRADTRTHSRVLPTAIPTILCIERINRHMRKTGRRFEKKKKKNRNITKAKKNYPTIGAFFSLIFPVEVSDSGELIIVRTLRNPDANSFITEQKGFNSNRL